MDYFLLVIALYLISAAQWALAPAMAVGDATPNLLAAAAAAWMLMFRDERSLVAATLWGLAADLASGGRLGVAAAAYLLVAYGILRARPPAPLPGWLTMASASLAVLVMTLAEAAARAVLAAAVVGETFWSTWWATGVYSALIAAGMVFVVRAAIAIFGPDEPAAWGTG